MDKNQLVEEALGSFIKLLKEYWLAQNFLTYQWWMMIILTIIPWIIWWKFADKKRIMEILLFGLLMMYITILIAPIERNLNIWQFLQSIHWSLNTLFLPFESTLLPVSYMLIYQYSKNWISFIIGTILLSCVTLFIFLPIFIKMKFISFNSYWGYIINFSILIIISLLSYWLVHSVFKKGSVNYDQQSS